MVIANQGDMAPGRGRGHGGGRGIGMINRFGHQNWRSAGGTQAKDFLRPLSTGHQMPGRGMHLFPNEFYSATTGFIHTGAGISVPYPDARGIQFPRAASRGHFQHNNSRDVNDFSARGRSNQPFFNSARGGRLSWADIRRQSQWNSSLRSLSTGDDSSEPDKSHRVFLNSGTNGGWGGRGRGRLLDSTSNNKTDNHQTNVESGSWGGRGRGGILFVPGVHFHKDSSYPAWKSNNTGTQRGRSTGHFVRGSGKNPEVANVIAHTSPALPKNQEQVVSSHNAQRNKKQQKRKQRMKLKENGDCLKWKVVVSDESVGRGNSLKQNEILPGTQNSSNTRNSQYKCNTVTDRRQPPIQVALDSKSEGKKLTDQEIDNKLEKLEISPKQLLLRTEAVTDASSGGSQEAVTMSKPPVEKQTNRKDNFKSGSPSVFKGGCQVKLLDGTRAAQDMQNTTTPVHVVEKRQSVKHTSPKPDENCNGRVGGLIGSLNTNNTAVPTI